jgi:ankyrin repeat protein
VKTSSGQKNFASLDESGKTMLHDAANEDNEMFFHSTIKGVENKNPKDIYGVTPFHISASKGNLPIIIN